MDKAALMEEFSHLDSTGLLAVYKAYKMGVADGLEMAKSEAPGVEEKPSNEEWGYNPYQE